MCSILWASQPCFALLLLPQVTRLTDIDWQGAGLCTLDTVQPHSKNSMQPAGRRTSQLCMQVVAEATPWQGGTVAISNFGFGGSNVHCLVSGHARALAAPLPAQVCAPSPVPSDEAAEPAGLDPEVRAAYQLLAMCNHCQNSFKLARWNCWLTPPLLFGRPAPVRLILDTSFLAMQHCCCQVRIVLSFMHSSQRI